MKRKKTVRICSRTWDIKASRNDGGASFETYGKSGAGRIVLGIRGQDRRYILEMLVHEIVEGILSHDDRRWRDKPNTNDSGGRILFCFDHPYMDDFVSKLLDALISCGVIDPKKKIVQKERCPYSALFITSVKNR